MGVQHPLEKLGALAKVIYFLREGMECIPVGHCSVGFTYPCCCSRLIVSSKPVHSTVTMINATSVIEFLSKLVSTFDWQDSHLPSHLSFSIYFSSNHPKAEFATFVRVFQAVHNHYLYFFVYAHCSCLKKYNLFGLVLLEACIYIILLSSGFCKSSINAISYA